MPIFSFKNQTQCRLSGGITSSQTVLPVGPGGSEFLPSSSGVMMAVIRDALGHEVVKVTGAAFGQITVERGQDGSTPRAFNLGTIVSARVTKSALVNGVQRGAMRQISYNPNEVTVPNYFGEKISEVGVDGCTHRIWQNVVAGSAQWRIVYGDMCKDLQNYREWNWPIVEYPWPEWPVPIIRPLMHVDAGKIIANDGDSFPTFTDLVGNVVDLSGEEKCWVAVRSPVTEIVEYYHGSNNSVESLGGGGVVIDNGYATFGPYTGDIGEWDGVLPVDAVDQFESTHKYIIDGSGKPCIRLLSSCIKSTSYGRSAATPTMTCRSRFSSGTTYTMFFVASGQSVYKSPDGTDARESSRITLVGTSSDPTYTGYGGAFTEGETQTQIELLAQSISYTWEWGNQYKGRTFWTFPGDEWNITTHYGQDISCPPPNISLISMEIDASNQRFELFVNGVFSETLSKLYAPSAFDSFPTSVLHFSSSAYYFNNTYDTMGVEYSCKLDVYEAVLYDMLFSEEDRASMESKLMEKWGITA